MRSEITKLQRKLGCTMIYVTHDQVEAMTMADKIVVLDAGFVSQVGKPLELYHYPQNRFVAGFIGSPKMNFMSVFIEGVEKIGYRSSFLTVRPSGSLWMAPLSLVENACR